MPKTHHYAKLKTIGTVTVIAKSILLLVIFVAVLADLIQIGLLSKLASGGYVAESTGNASDAFYQSIGLAQGWLGVLAFLIFLGWYGRAYNNLDALGIKKKTTVGWAIADFFIPIIFFVEPYRRMKEIWTGGFGKKSGTKLILGWWLIFWLKVLAGKFGVGILKKAVTLDKMITGSIWIFLSDLLQIAGTIILIVLLVKISRSQDKKGLKN